jgi:hypothetical protein
MSGTLDWLRHGRERWQRRRRHARHLRELAEHSRERDPAENAESSPPPDEQIRLHAVWMAESYPVSFFDVLLEAVRRLAAEGRHISGTPPAEQLEHGLRRGGAGWFPLGPVVRPGSPLFAYLPPIEAALPTEVEYAHASVHYLVPWHAVLVMCFVLDETGSGRVEQALRANYQTHTTQHRNWTAIHGPGNQKREAVRKTRADQLTGLATFFGREAPGLFASEGEFLPSIELWTTNEVKPFDDSEEARGARGMHDFTEILGWIAWTNLWHGPYNLALKEAPVTGDDLWSRAPNLQLVARERDLFADEDLDMYGGRSREAYVNRLGDGLGPLTATLALTETFRFYESEIVGARRRLREAQSRSLRRRVKATVAVQDRLLRQHADVDALARGVSRWSDYLLDLLRRHAYDFERWRPPSVRGDDADEQAASAPRRRWLGGRLWRRRPEREGRAPTLRPWPRETWLEAQAEEITSRAEHVVGGSREISDVVRAVSETTATQSSLRLQRWVAILTWVLAGIGIATLIVVIVTAK